MSRRARDLGLRFGPLPTGAHNGLTDVTGVRVGHSTVVQEGLRSGVTAIVPAGVGPKNPLRAGFFAGNGYGKVVGTTQVQELGQIETPVLLTGTLSTFRAADALVEWVLTQPGNEDVRSVNPVVAETNDSRWRKDRHRAGIEARHVLEALAGADSGAVGYGSVGAGTGTVAFGLKGGLGSASRLVSIDGTLRTVGVLVQTNHDGRLAWPGLDVPASSSVPSSDGSVVVVVVTDAPLDARQLTRLARRGVYALARTGAAFSGGSGDYCLSVSTVPVASADRVADDHALDPLWSAVQDCVDEAVLDSLAAADPVLRWDGVLVPVLVQGR
ncbi:MAG: P1 family peptidase [Actinobacteria bacterium]|nr:P1 family peptidase [Actinomycetota bacterium]MCA1720962.1 P1 family peptidase [Actinomycetota bacterium]